MNTPFRFKQFSIQQDKCAMKVGTDGVLLGAWTSLEDNPYAILDIGAGTGLISLMLAQRSQATIIDAIEIDAEAYEQCVANFEQSIWNDCLFCYHAGLDEFVDEIEDQYDLIVSNPPFYSETVTSGNDARDMARMSFSLPFHELLASVAELLHEEGTFAVIIPFKEEVKFSEIAARFQLFPKRITHVKGTLNSEFKRSLMEFSFRHSSPLISELTIEKGRHQYTEDYINLTKEFYLKM